MKALHLLIALASLSVGLDAARAQADQGSTAQVEQLYQEATTLFRDGVYRKALEKFLMGHALYPDFNFIYNAARCYEELGEVNEAIAKFEEVLTFEETDARTRQRAEARLAALRLRKASPPPPPEPPPLVAPPATQAGGVEAKISPADEGGAGVLPWLVTGAGVAVVGAGAVFYMMAGEDYDEGNDVGTRRPDALEAWEEGDDNMSRSKLLFATGGALVLGGAALFYFSGGDSAETAALKASWAPQQGGGLVTLQGGF